MLGLRVSRDFSRLVDVKAMESVLRLGADRCCFCQSNKYTLANPKVKIVATATGTPVDNLVAHAQCDEPVKAWRRGRM